MVRLVAEGAIVARRSNALTEVQPFIPELLDTTIVPSGATRTAIMVASGQIPDVQTVFVGSSYGSGTLLPAP